jgi:hypothetical protein
VALVKTDVLEERIMFLHSVLQLLVIANMVPSSLILLHPDGGGDTFI